MSTSSSEGQADFLGGWEQLCDYDTFVKWGYFNRDGDCTPYRVIADLDERRGHWRVVFTSTYGGSYLIAGNLGLAGRLKAVVMAQNWMHANKWGCPPPNQYEK